MFSRFHSRPMASSSPAAQTPYTQLKYGASPIGVCSVPFHSVTRFSAMDRVISLGLPTVRFWPAGEPFIPHLWQFVFGTLPLEHWPASLPTTPIAQFTQLVSRLTAVYSPMQQAMT